MELFLLPSHPICYQLSISDKTTSCHGDHSIIHSNSTTVYQQSFYPRAITDWNDLATKFIIEVTDIEGFSY